MVGKIIRYMRKSCGLSQEQLGNIVNIGRSTVSDYEREKTDINFANLEKIANKCGFKIYFESENEKIEVKDLERKDI